MQNINIHEAIRNLYTNVITIRDNKCFDENNNIIDIDMFLVNIEAQRLSKIIPISLNDIIKNQNDKIINLQEQINKIVNNIN